MPSQQSSRPSLIDLLGPLAPVINIVDVGAMHLPDPDDRMSRLFKPDKFSVVGFEPVKAECDKLNGMGRKGHRYLPYFIGDGSDRTFYLTAYSQTASLYKPNEAIINLFQTLPQLKRVIETTPVKTHRLDDLTEIKHIDYLKLDVQGAELDCLRGATRLLKDVLLIQCEVEFIEIYEKQPLFADVDSFLRAHGFMLHTAALPSGRCYWPFVFNNQPNSNGSQHMWTDAIYIRDVRRMKELSPQHLLKTAVLVHELVDSFDLAALLLKHYDEKVQSNLWQRYMNFFMTDPPARAPVRDVAQELGQ